ncbi:hypothetical protein [Bacteriovorax sp. DB6_IX]|uniref:hypothetical protein n=1 Tax=Bacteriovorax sp. DB6_IX TaxID=1353530 RepID=UPI0012F8E0EE|nr:hypothetical protein [Bacteriovorax sp. DB6_IX]
MKRLVLVFLFISQFALSAESESGFLYRTVRNNTKVSLFYDARLDEYTYKRGSRSYRYPRFRYKDIFTKHMFEIPDADFEELKDILRKHASTQRSSKATPEEILGSGLKMLDQAQDIISPADSPCHPYQGAPKAQRIVYSQTKEQAKREDDLVLDTALADEGFFKMGKLTGTKLELMSCNDNPLHGALGAAGMTEFGEGIEGDDRGKTFCIKGDATLEFEKGSISFRRTSDGYGRLTSKPGKVYYYGGRAYQSEVYRDENGKRYQEFLSIDGYELEIVRKLGENDTYVKVIGRYKTMDDTSGLSKSLQESWHENMGAVEYAYVDHMDKKSGFEGYIELGRDFEVYSSDDIKVTATPSAGIQGSQLGETESFVSVAGEVKAVFLDDVGDKKFPSWEARAYIKRKQYLDSEDGTLKGVEITKRFAYDENNFIYLKAGIGEDEDRWSKSFGGEEMRRNGSLDFQHTLGIGFEHKF